MTQVSRNFNQVRASAKFVPVNIVLYDLEQHKALLKAKESYNNIFPSLVGKSNTITNEELISATICAERFLANFSLVFGIRGVDNVFFHHRYKIRDTVSEMPLAFVAEVFCNLGNTMNHPAYTMLRLVYSVAYDRSKAYQALRDIRWAYENVSSGITLVATDEVFREIGVMLREFTHAAYYQSKNAGSDVALKAFEDYLFDGRGDYRINCENFAVVVALAVAVYECSNRRIRS